MISRALNIAIGKRYLLKSGSSMRIAQVLVRVMLQCQLPVSFLDLCFLSLSPNFQDFVEGPRRSHDGLEWNVDSQR